MLFEPPHPWSREGEWRSSTLSSDYFLNPHDVAVIPAGHGGRERLGQGQGQGEGEGVSEGMKDALLVSSHEGIHRLDISRTAENSFTAVITELTGAPEDDPADVNARDVGVKPLPQDCSSNPPDLHGVTALTKNVLDISTLPYLATIDYTNTTGQLPGQVWHGDQVSLYFPEEGHSVVEGGFPLTRKVLEKRYSGGHTAVVFDFDGDGCLDVMAGFRVSWSMGWLCAAVACHQPLCYCINSTHMCVLSIMGFLK